MNFDEINRVITFELNEEDFFLEPEKARLNILNAYQKAKKIGKVTKSVFLLYRKVHSFLYNKKCKG
ncbi:MAG: hypothetical protein ABRQ25_14820 [Clostridiaceae bacterium]